MRRKETEAVRVVVKDVYVKGKEGKRKAEIEVVRCVGERYGSGLV